MGYTFYEDVSGNDLTIVGIYDTNIDSSRYQRLADSTQDGSTDIGYSLLMNEYENLTFLSKKSHTSKVAGWIARKMWDNFSISIS